MSAADPTLAIGVYLLEKLGDQVDGRVFAPELPEEEQAGMPKPTIVVLPAPGGGSLTSGNRLPLADSNIYVFCYGTRLGADQLCREVEIALRELTQGVWEDVLVYWVRPSGGPTPGVEEQTLWPYAVLTAQVLHSEQTVS